MEETTQTNQNDLFDASESYSEPEIQPEVEPEVNESKDEFEEWDKKKAVDAYQNLQRKITEREKMYKQEMQERLRAEEKLKLIESQSKPSSLGISPLGIPKRPDPLPPKPADFTMLDAFDESTPSGQWYAKKLDKDIQWDTYNRYVDEEREKSEQMQREQQKAVEFRNQKISEIQQTGASLQESMETIEWLMSPESGKPENIIAYRRYIKGLQAKPKGQRPGVIQSPSSIPSENEPKPNDSRDFFNSFGNKGQDIFKTG